MTGHAGALRSAAAAGMIVLIALAIQDENGLAASRPASRPAADGPLVVISGNEHGFIRPCGCSKPALGGVHRRAHAIAELRKTEPRLAAVSVGEFVVVSDRQQELKVEAFFLSLAEMGYSAFVPGAGEFKLGRRYICDARGLCEGGGRSPVPFVVANAAYPGEEVFAKSAPLADTGGVLIGLVGPLPPEYGVTVTPAAEALRAEIAAARDAAFILIVYNGDKAGLPPVAEAVPENLRSKTCFAIPGLADTPVREEPVLGMPVVTAGMKGRAIGLLRPTGVPLFVPMTLEESLPGVASVEAILDGYRTSVRDEGLMKNVAKTPAAGGWVGDKKCAECHKDAYDKLLTTPHQRAMKSLAKTRDDFDPECVRCHVTGWAQQGAFVDHDATPQHKNVNCEACHGPGAEHSKNPKQKTIPGKIDQSTCLRCHDPDNSPQFKFEKYWPRIEHK